MLRVGLTGGIGSGKSTVAAGLARRGALVVDADRIARDVVEPGGPAYDAVVGRFGPAVVRADGTLDRPALAAIVFNDADALADLNRITHPVIGAAVLRRVADLARTGGEDGVVVLDQPLLTAEGAAAYGLEVVVVVDTPVDVAVGRLVAHRGFAEADARARVASQMDRETRLGFADIVIDNEGDVDGLEREIDRAWSELVARAAGGPAGAST